ncbi:Uncharacterized protein Adt_39832 [Abeliophyllum distichum]|uniref:Uncharacterized protein n=1 Tax=Abeliophyllum distichum TaxID=126358 RepID=A0ABD1Q677_9LAMI
MPSSSSSKEEAPQATRIDRCPVLIGKNVDPASFTFDAPSFHIEDLFVGMGWVSILTLNDKVDPSITKEFYKKITFSPGTGISCLVRNKRIKITQEFIHSILHLEDGGIRLYTTKTIPHLEEYNLVKACCRVTEKHFKIPARLSPSTFPFEGGEEMDEEEDEPPLSSTSGFTEGHFNLLNGRIDSLISSVEGLHHTVEGLCHTMGTLQQSVDGMTTLLQALHSRLEN